MWIGVGRFPVRLTTATCIRTPHAANILNGGVISYKDKTFQDRYKDEFWQHSERKFEALWPHRWQRFGLNKDDGQVDLWKLDPFIRFTPDYVTQINGGEPFLVEVQGTGKDRLHKFKFDKLENIGKWNKVQPTVYWLWDDTLARWDVISYPALRLLITRGLATQDQFDGHRPYWAVPVETIQEHSDYKAVLEKYGG